MSTIAEKIQAGLVRTGKTAAQIARETGLNERTVRSYASGERSPAHSSRERIENALEMRVGSLIDGEPTSESFQAFARLSGLAKDPELEGVVAFLGRHLNDSELAELGVEGNWRIYETLASVMHDALSMWRNKEALAETHQLEMKADARRAAITRVKSHSQG